jgi:hypothetical protein
MSYHSPDDFDAQLKDNSTYLPNRNPTNYQRLKAMFRVAEARRRIRLEEYTPSQPETPNAMRDRLLEVSRRGIARVSYCTDTNRASVAWIEPSSYYEGDGAAGLMFLREDVDLTTAETTGCFPFAAISWHAMNRLVERSGVINLDQMDRAAAAGLCWSHVARQTECEGEYIVPHVDGVFCCVALPRGVVEGGRSWAISLIKTWINEDELDVPLYRAREGLLTATKSKSPFFPGFNDVDAWQDASFFLMREAGRAREYIRNNGYGIVNDDRFAPWQAA